MKKHYFIFAAALMALASCSTDDVIGGAQTAGNTSDGAINFASEMGKITRADLTHEESAAALDNNFVVVGFKGNATDAANTGYVFDHYNVNYSAKTAGSTESNTADWEYVNQAMTVKGIDKSLAQNGATAQTIKYWDHSCGSYDFLAFSLGKGYKSADDAKVEYATPTAVNKEKLASEAYTLQGDVNTLSQCYISDMATVEKSNYSKKAVSMTFRHATSKVRMALFETIPGYVVNDVKFYSTSNTTSKQATTTPDLYGKFNSKGTMTVSFPVTGTEHKNDKNWNKAHTSFKPTETINDLTFKGVNYTNEKEDALTETNTYLGQTRSNASYCGEGTDGKDYFTVLPAENNGGAITLKVDYTLTATDGTKETIKVTGATATIPAEYTQWKHGYAYTYIFKISQNTNGSTGGEGSDDKGLTAISFDAVVQNDETTDNQETITTVSTPSITTYGFKDGQVTENGNEYVGGTDIYATVHVPAIGETAATTAAPTALYTVTLEAGATQTINEASIANAIAKGTPAGDDDSKTYTVTDVNNKKLVVTTATKSTTTVQSVPTADGAGLKVNALKWTATAGTIYAVEYTYSVTESEKTVTKKAYKIVNVAK